MKCPEIDRLIEATGGDRLDLAVQDHLRTCDSCRRDAFLLTELSAAFSPDAPVPEPLLASTLSSIEFATLEDDRPLWSDRLIAGFLGFLTTALAFLASGANAGSVGALAAFCVFMGVAAAYGQSRLLELAG